MANLITVVVSLVGVIVSTSRFLQEIKASKDMQDTILRNLIELLLTSGLGDVAIFRVTSAGTGDDQRYEVENIFYSWALFVRLICR